MITIIESILGSKVGRVAAEILLVLILFFAYRAHVLHEGADAEMTRLKTSSAALIVKAQKEISVEAAAHAATLKANQGKTDAALAANAALQLELTQRVRDFDTYRRAHPDLPSAGGGPSAAVAGECGAQRCSDLALRLAEGGDELARSAGDLAASLQSCERERDSLTGLPKEPK